MAQDFKISPQMTKKEMIEEHERLLEAYRDKAREGENARRQAAAAQAEAEALARSREATVDGVAENISQLRKQMATTLGHLLDRTTEQAERLESLNRAVTTHEQRLAELRDVEVASITLDALFKVYDERRRIAEEQYSAQLGQMEESFRRRREELETKHEERQSDLQREIADHRARWKSEKESVERALAEEAERRQRDRQREEDEYSYQRDRQRKLEQDQVQDERGRRERDLAEREAALAAREGELASLRRELEAMPQRLETERAQAAEQAHQAALAQVEHERQLALMERQWETKMLKDRIAHLDGDVKVRDAKLAELKADLDAALRQAHQLAEKALDRSSAAPARGLEPPPRRDAAQGD